MPIDQAFGDLLETTKRAAALLRDAEIPFALGGGLASWARGGPQSEHDADFFIRPEDADRALEAFAEAGMRTERPPEGWLVKAYDGDTLIDLIYDPNGGPVTDEWLARAEEVEVAAMRMPVASLEDVLVTKLLAVSEQRPDLGGALEMARSLREQVDWDDVRARTEAAPFAKAFFVLLAELDVAST